MPSKNERMTDELRQLLPLTSAVFFILFALAEGEKHGYAIMQKVAELSDKKFRLGPATLYTTIQRLLDLCLIEELDNAADSRRRNYRLTPSGRAVFKAELDRMDAVVRLAVQHRQQGA